MGTSSPLSSSSTKQPKYDISLLIYYGQYALAS
jgi:hypothetical protein